MRETDLIQSYRDYLSTLRKKDGSNPSSLYIKDKISRLRRIIDTLGFRTVQNVGERNFFKICDALIDEFTHKASAAQSRAAYGDYLVVIRQLYEMNTGQIAPRYKYYAGVRVV